MTPSFTDPALAAHPVCRHGLTVDEQAKLELLEELPVRLERDALDTIVHLLEEGSSLRAIATRTRLHPVVIVLELRRELRHRVEQRDDGAQAAREDESAGLSWVNQREWNRLAKGTHVPNRPVRELLETVLRARPCLSRRAVFADARVCDTTHGQRLLGIKPYPGSKRLTQTIRCDKAASIARALGCDPVEVPGL
jgi:hypothetical protein